MTQQAIANRVQFFKKYKVGTLLHTSGKVHRVKVLSVHKSETSGEWYMRVRFKWWPGLDPDLKHVVYTILMKDVVKFKLKASNVGIRGF